MNNEQFLLNENTIYGDDAARAEIMKDPNLVKTLFWINNLGFLALKKNYPKHFMVTKTFKNLKSARITNINSEDNDIAVTLKMAFDQGYLKYSFVNEYTKLLYILKSRQDVDLDEAALRALFDKVNWPMMMPDARIRAYVKKWLDGECTLGELIKPFYQYSVIHKTNEGFKMVAKVTGAFSADFEDDSVQTVDDKAVDDLIKPEVKAPEPAPVVEPVVPAYVPAPVAPPVSVLPDVAPDATDNVVDAPVDAPVADVKATDVVTPVKRGRGRPRKNPIDIVNATLDPVVAPAAETTTIDKDTGDVVVTKPRGRAKKTAAEVVVTNKVAVREYDDDRYKAILDSCSTVLSINPKMIDPDSYTYNGDLSNLVVYAVAGSAYAKDVAQYYNSIFGDKRSAKKYINANLRSLMYLIVNYYTVNSKLELDKKFGFGECGITAGGFNIPKDTYDRMYSGRLYRRDEISATFEDIEPQLIEQQLTPTLKEYYDAISTTFDYLYSESEYKKSVEKFFAGYSHERISIGPFGPYDVNNLTDFSRFEKSPLIYYNFQGLVDMYHYKNDIDGATNIAKIVVGLFPQMVAASPAFAKNINVMMAQILNFSYFNSDDFGKIVEFFEWLSTKEQFLDLANSVVTSNFNVIMDRTFEKYPLTTDLGKRFMAIVSSGIFAKLKIVPSGVPEVREGSAGLQLLLGKYVVGLSRALGLSTDYYHTFSEDNFAEEINQFLGSADGDYNELAMIDEDKFNALLKENGLSQDAFAEKVVNTTVKPDEVSKMILSRGLGVFGKSIAFKLFDLILDNKASADKDFIQFSVILGNTNNSSVSKHWYMQWLKTNRQTLIDLIKGTRTSPNTQYMKANYAGLFKTYDENTGTIGNPSSAKTTDILDMFYAKDENLYPYYKSQMAYWTDPIIAIAGYNDATCDAIIRDINNGGLAPLTKDELINLAIRTKGVFQALVPGYEFKIRLVKIIAAYTRYLVLAGDDQIVERMLVYFPVADFGTNFFLNLLEPDVITDAQKVNVALRALFSDPTFESTDKYSIQDIANNKELVLNIISINFEKLILASGVDYGQRRSVFNARQFDNFFHAYDKVGELIGGMPKNWHEFFGYLIIGAIDRMSTQQLPVPFFRELDIDNYKVLTSGEEIVRAFNQYVEYIVKSRRRNTNDPVASTLVIYSRDWFKIYTKVINRMLAEANRGISPTIAKNLNVGTMFNGVITDDKLTADQKKTEFEELLSAVYGDTKLTPTHLTSIADDLVRQKAINQIIATKKQLIPIYSALTPKGVAELLKFNDFQFDVDSSGVDVSAKSIKSNGAYKTLVDAIAATSASNVPDAQVTRLDLTSDELDKVTYELFEKKYNNKHGDIAGLVMDVYDVHIRPKELLDFKAAYPNAKVERELFHGTGSVAANMILRFGFKNVSSDIAGVKVTGKMLGEGIYLSPVMEKSLQYVGDAGFGRKFGTIGYIFECALYTYNERNEVRKAGYGSDNIRSPELAVSSGRSQIEIYKCYKVKLVSKSILRDKSIKRT